MLVLRTLASCRSLQSLPAHVVKGHNAIDAFVKQDPFVADS